MTMTAAQIRAARALLAWTVTDLAARTGLGADVLAEAEAERRPLGRADADSVEAAFRRAGVVAVPEGGGGVGVRFQRPAGREDQGLAPNELNSANDG